MGLFENEPESLTGDRELIPFDEALIVCFADSDDLAGGEACPSRSRLSFLRAFGNGLTQALQGLFIGPSVGLGDDLDQMGQRVGLRRRGALLEHVAGSRLGIVEEVTGNRQTKEPLVSGRGCGRLLPRSEAFETFQSAPVKLEELPVVIFIDRLDVLVGFGRTGGFWRCQFSLISAIGLAGSHPR